MNNHTALKAENILLTLADRMSALGTFNMGGQTEMAVIICPEHYNTLNRQGWDKAMGMAPRIENLQNGVLGVIDNGKTNSDTVLNRIVSKLAERFSLKDVVTVKKHSVSHAIKDDAARMLAQKCNFILAGIGD